MLNKYKVGIDGSILKNWLIIIRVHEGSHINLIIWITGGGRLYESGNHYILFIIIFTKDFEEISFIDHEWFGDIHGKDCIIAGLGGADRGSYGLAP